MATTSQIISHGIFLISFFQNCYGAAETALLENDATGTTATVIKMSIKLPEGGTTSGISAIGELLCDGVACPAPDVTKSLDGTPPTVTIGGRTPSQEYTIDMKTLTGVPASPGLEDIIGHKICTTLDDITDVSVDAEATTEKEIKITWAASTGKIKPSYTLYLDGEEIGSVPASDPTEFTFTETNTKDKVELLKTTAHTCKITATADAGCGASNKEIVKPCSLKEGSSAFVLLASKVILLWTFLGPVVANVFL